MSTPVVPLNAPTAPSRLNLDLLKANLPRYRAQASTLYATSPFLPPGPELHDSNAIERRMLDRILGPSALPARIGSSKNSTTSSSSSAIGVIGGGDGVGVVPAVGGGGLSGGLIAALTSRLASVEATATRSCAELAARDGEIATLRRQVEMFSSESHRNRSSSEASASAAVSSDTDLLRVELRVSRAETAAITIQLDEARSHVTDMERFLADYGLVWCGGGGVNGGERAAGDAAPAGVEAPLDFPVLFLRLQQLNSLAGEGRARIVAKNGAHQISTEPIGGRISLTIFRDGFLLRRGPFRKYTEDTARAFVSDIVDGYFPYELKDTSPEGIVFDIVDRSRESGDAVPNAVMDDRGFAAFGGHGRSLGGVAVKINDTNLSRIAAFGDPFLELPAAVGGGG